MSLDVKVILLGGLKDKAVNKYNRRESPSAVKIKNQMPVLDITSISHFLSTAHDGKLFTPNRREAAGRE